MKNKKYIVLILSSLLSLNAFSQSNVIKKCINKEGNILYFNEAEEIEDGYKCKKTELGNVIKNINTTNVKVTNNDSNNTIVKNNIISTNTNTKEMLEYNETLKNKKIDANKKIESVNVLIKNKKNIINGLINKIQDINIDNSVKNKITEEINNHKKDLLNLEIELDVLNKENSIVLNVDSMIKINGPKPPTILPNDNLPKEVNLMDNIKTEIKPNIKTEIKNTTINKKIAVSIKKEESVNKKEITSIPNVSHSQLINREEQNKYTVLNPKDFFSN